MTEPKKLDDNSSNAFQSEPKKSPPHFDSPRFFDNSVLYDSIRVTGDYFNNSTNRTSVIGGNNRSELRRWWHDILRTKGKYTSYAFFMLLPSDVSTIEYIKNYGTELNLLSGKNCLILMLGKVEGGNPLEEGMTEIALDEYINKGYSTAIARFFKIKLQLFPCVVFFEDIRSDRLYCPE